MSHSPCTSATPGASTYRESAEPEDAPGEGHHGPAPAVWAASVPAAAGTAAAAAVRPAAVSASRRAAAGMAAALPGSAVATAAGLAAARPPGQPPRPPRRGGHLVRNILSGIGAVVVAGIAISALSSHGSGVSTTPLGNSETTA